MSLEKIGDVLREDNLQLGAPTSFDLPNVGDLNDEEIEKYIRNLIREDLSDPNTFKKLNIVYKKALVYLEEELLYNGELKRFKNKNDFEGVSDLVNFLKDTTTLKGRMNCVITKVFLSFYDSDADFSSRVKKVKDKTQGVIDGKLLGPLRVLKSNDDEYSGEEYFELQAGKIRKIPYKLKKRIKSVNSMVSKEIRDPEYFTINRTSDMHGLTFEVQTKKDILPLMHMVAGYVFKRGDYEIKNDKGMFSKEDVVKNTEVNQEFKERVLEGTLNRNKPESGNVVDIKLLTPKEKQEESKNMNIEIKFTVIENRNEDGLNMHGVYNYAKKLKERIRLEGYITDEYIERVTNSFLEKLSYLLVSNVGRPEEDGDDVSEYKEELFLDLQDKNFIRKELNLSNPHTKCKIINYLRQGLIQYFKSTLTPVNVNGGKKRYYTNQRALNISKNNLGGDVLTSLLD